MGHEVLSPVDAVRLALAELGEVPAADLAAFIGQRYGVKVEPRFLPILKATLAGQAHLAESRARARAAALAALPPPETPTPPA